MGNIQIPSPYVKMYTLEGRNSSVSHTGGIGWCLHINYNAIQYILSRYVECSPQGHHRCQQEIQPGRPLAGVIDRIREWASDALEYEEEPHGNSQNNLARNQNLLAVRGSKQARVGIDERSQEKGRELCCDGYQRISTPPSTKA